MARARRLDRCRGAKLLALGTVCQPGKSSRSVKVGSGRDDLITNEVCHDNLSVFYALHSENETRWRTGYVVRR